MSVIAVNGTPASCGITMGPIKHLNRGYTGLNRSVLDPSREAALFSAALILAKDELSVIIERSHGEEKDILNFQRTMLDDESLIEEITNYILAGAGGAAAVERAADIFSAKIRSIDDAYLCERAADIIDACHRVVDILDGRPREQLLLKSPAIVVADEIYPSDIVSIERGMILGFVTSFGSTQGHAAIVARTLGIPSVVMAGEDFIRYCDGHFGALDGTSGEFYIEPDEGTKARFSHKIRSAQRRTQRLSRLKDLPCVTQSGRTIKLFANCTSPEDIEAAISTGADGIGLLRSEFILMSGRVPTEEEQYYFYTSCLLAAAGKPLTVRTFDIGADKEVEGLTPACEPNPALGLRGLRFSLARKDIFSTQIAALLRAGQKGDLRIMFPMVTTPKDLDEALLVVETVKKSLLKRGVTFRDNVPLGIMIETPAAALLADELSLKSDFFSIGTNDLTQYTHAVDRVNPLVEDYFPTVSLAVRKLMKMAITAANAAKIPICICGETAANPEIAADYVTMGVDTLSMTCASILEVKERILTIE